MQKIGDIRLLTNSPGTRLPACVIFFDYKILLHPMLVMLAYLSDQGVEYAGMSTMRANQLKTGVFVLYKGQPHAVVKCEFYFPGKGSAFARTRMKNVKTGNVYEYTFKSAEMVETVDVDTVELQYLYSDGDTYYFMNPQTYDQFEVEKSLFEGKEKYLLPEMKMFVNFYEGVVIGVRFPLKVTVKVTEAQEASAGNTVNAPKKPVTIETGVEVMAPLFIKQGENIIVDTTTDEYVSRA